MNEEKFANGLEKVKFEQENSRKIILAELRKEIERLRPQAKRLITGEE